jgi:hypothetical protein
MTLHVQQPTAKPGRMRRVSTWVTIGIALLLIGGVGAVIAAGSQWADRDALDPESPGPNGTRALAQILAQNGVEVRVVRSHGDVTAALSRGDATLVLPDTPALSDEGWSDITGAAADVVLIDPRTRTLRLAVPGASISATGAPGTVDPGCELAEAVRSGPTSPSTLFEPATPSESGTAGVTTCYREGDSAGLLVTDDGGRRTAVIDGTALFTNEHLAEDGNAALGVNLMGRHPLLVWYQPGPGDTDLPQTDPTLGELTPPWVSPVIVLLLVAGVAAGFWRGRRFGPLVAERLPVTVRASETTEGRARLYAQSRDALHAADQLRLGALDRLARTLGLGPAASAADIADAAAARGGVDRGEARRILIDDIPATDADLVNLHQRLRQLEDVVNTATRPERKPR